MLHVESRSAYVTRANSWRVSLAIGGTAFLLVVLLLGTRKIASLKATEAKPSQQTTGALVQSGNTAGHGGARKKAPASPRSGLPVNPKLATVYARLPLGFEANQGQTDPQVKFLSRGRGYGLFLTSDEAILTLREPAGAVVAAVGKPSHLPEFLIGSEVPKFEAELARRLSEPLQQSALRMRLVGGAPDASVVGLGELPGKSNYFIGSDRNKWHTQIPTYTQVRYQGVYPGVDLVYHGNHGRLEYDFVVGPGANPGAIRLEVRPLSQVTNTPARIDSRGDLVVSTQSGEVRFHKPTAYQQSSRSRRPRSTSLVAASFVLQETGYISFEVGEYDRSKPLIIDPILTYSTFLGGSGDDFGNAISVDGLGNIYVTGGTTSSDFPVSGSVVQTAYGGPDGGYQAVNGDVFVSKLNPSGTALVYSTYLGGKGDDNAYSIVVDNTGSIYLAGGTNSSDFPVTPVLIGQRPGSV